MPGLEKREAIKWQPKRMVKASALVLTDRRPAHPIPAGPLAVLLKAQSPLTRHIFLNY